MSKRQFVVLVLLLSGAGLAGTSVPAAHAQPPQPVTPSLCPLLSVVMQAGKSEPVAQLCTSGGTLEGVQPSDSINRYYGVVVATTNISSVETAANRRSIGDFFARLFKKEDYTVLFSVSAELDTANGKVPLAETPLLVLVRKSNGSIDAASEINQMAGTPVTPYFALSSVNSGVTFRFKVTVVDKTTFTAADIFADGLKAASGVGAHGWLISAISEPLVLSAVTTAQERVSRYFSEQQATQISTRLDFNNPGQAASLVFQTSTNSSFGGKSEYKLSLKLVARPSLITEVTRPDNAGVPLVEGPAAPSLGTWAQNIPVAPKLSLAASIENDGVPSKLTALQAGAASRQPLSVRDTIDAACTDLESALRGGKYFRLNETDADLVLYEQLHRAGVLQADFRNTVGCVTRLMSRWKERYRLAIPDVGVQPIDIPYPDMETRLKAFAGIWKNANPDVRAAGVTFNVIKPLPVEVDPQLFPSVAPSLVDTGRGTGAGSLNPAGLMETKMLCFGGWRKTDKNAASGMAQFDAATPYVVSLTFENMRPYDSNAGPQITSLLVRKATKEDLEKATGPSCLK